MRFVAIAVVLAAACGSKKPAKQVGSDAAPRAGADDEATPIEPDDTAGSGAGTPTAGGTITPAVDLTLTGAVTATIKGTGGTCVCKNGTASITLRSDEFGVQPSFDLNLVVTTAEEWTSPAVSINVKAPQRGSYGRALARNGGTDKLSMADDCTIARIEQAVLAGIATKGEITLRGTITCRR
jgi:hypothetical protein